MSMHGYSGSNYDRFVENTNNTSTLHRMKETYWTTKQVVIRKLGKKEDEHVVASDSELDAKLETFKAIQKSCMDLLRVIEKYQDRLCVVSQEENAIGRFLKSHSGHDKTRAGKMMAAVGKSQSFAAQQRLALRVPLVRLYQEVETFRYRAISDTLVTINRMESARTEYRGALLWMKDVSEELDPDTYKQLEKFRKVQSQVRKTKARFDKLKLDVMQKVDLLAASRCNMFSHVLANYQATLLHFWEKTSRTMAAVAESFKGYQYYEFNMLKELTEPSLKLTEEVSKREPAEKESDVDPEKTKFVSNLLGDDKDEEGQEEEEEEEEERDRHVYRHLHRPYSPYQQQRPDSPSDVDRSWEADSHCRQCGQPLPEDRGSLENLARSPDMDRLLSLDDDEATDALLAEEMKNRTAIASTKDEGKTEVEKSKAETEEDSKKDEFGPFIDFEEEENQEDFDFSGKIPESAPKHPRPEGPKDLLTEGLEADDADKDDLTLLNEILNAPSTGEDEFTQEWQAVFGGVSMATSSPSAQPAELDVARQPPTFMPSSLLDLASAPAPDAMGPLQQPGMAAPSGGSSASPGAPASSKAPPKSKAGKKGQKADMSAWFNLFAELDPLSNPDAIGQPQQQEKTDA